MDSGLAFFGLCFPSLFSIVDPLAAAPMYLALVGDDERAHQKRTALRASVTMLLMLAVFATTGTLIFKFFGITIPAFRLAGGVLLFLMALEMMRAKHSEVRSTTEETDEAKTKADVGIIPLGIPLLSGPGAVASAMMWSSRAHGAGERVALYGAIAAVAVVTFVTLLFATRLVRLFGKTGINVITRIMGLILAATAAQFMIDGALEAMGRGAGPG